MKYDELLADLRGWTRVSVSYEGSIDELLDKAADAIEELQSQLPKWIPVTERLPENDKTVLVWDRRNSREYFNICEHGRWIILRQEDITHWMPLPEPPKEEKDG
jgi:hypothetical protein